MREIPKFVVLCTILCLFAQPSAAQLAFPPELVADAERRGCAVETDTAAYPGETVRLFRYGVLEAARDSATRLSAAYWCSTATGERRSLLVIWRATRDKPIPGGCSDFIAYWNPPASLRFEHQSTVRLEGYRVVDEPRRFGPSVLATGTVIVSEYDGVIARFVCHGGLWYVAQWH